MSDLTAKDFLREASQFHLGSLETEKGHPLTQNLSHLARTDIPQALEILYQVDLQALQIVDMQIAAITELALRMHQTLTSGNRVFLCGCGATGRLSVALETLWREEGGDGVVSFMAGGDYALVRSVENFEDFPEYGKRQLKDLGFRPEDLVIGITEGGETPFVIGAVEAAVEAGTQKPYFLYCNPDSVLKEKVERSRRVIVHPDIVKINLTCGPMAVSGSTRLQAATVLMLATGAALFSRGDAKKVKAQVQEFSRAAKAETAAPLQPFIQIETETYLRGDKINYVTDRFGITLLTDTTERSPTFSLTPFENRQERDLKSSLCYLRIEGAKDAEAAWATILHRKPRSLDWNETVGQVMGFDFSEAQRDYRVEGVEFFVGGGVKVEWRLKSEHARWNWKGLSLLSQHLLLKLLLNRHSVLVMGGLGRFEGNRMTYVRPSNKKLIDRAVRYVQALLEKRGVVVPDYAEITDQLFELKQTLPVDEPLVLRLAELFQRNAKR